MGKKNNNGRLILRSGTAWENGGCIYLYGKDYSSNPGETRVVAHNGSQYAEYFFRTNGTLDIIGTSINTKVLTAKDGLLLSPDNAFADWGGTHDITLPSGGSWYCAHAMWTGGKGVMRAESYAGGTVITVASPYTDHSVLAFRIA